MVQVATVVDGNECIARLTFYEPGSPMQITGTGFGDAIAPDPEDAEFELLHPDETPWPELYRKLGRMEKGDIEKQLIEELNDAYACQ